MVSLGPRSLKLLDTWADVITQESSGVGYDLSQPTRSAKCRDRLQEFLAEPKDATFRALWTPEVLAAADEWSADVVINLYVSDFEATAEQLASIPTAEEYRPEWSDVLPISAVGMELYGRTHQPASVIPSDQAVKALRKFNLSSSNAFEARVTSIQSFIELYRNRVGHLLSDSGIPLTEEVDQLFRLVTTVTRDDLEAGIDGPQKELFQALLGYEGPNTGGQSGPITVYRDSAWSAVDGHLDARNRGAYDDLEETEHWGGTHIETWKWDFAEYVEEVIKSEFTLDELGPEDIDPFFDRWNASSDAYGGRIGSQTPKKMMSRYGKDKYTYACEFCRENPEQAADKLSTLFDESIHVETRLEQFEGLLPDDILKAGSLLRFVSSFLMFAYPQEYVTFQYQRFNDFFSAHTSVESLETGFDTRQYYRVVLACRDIRDWLAEDLDDASMLDVHTLIYVHHDA